MSVHQTNSGDCVQNLNNTIMHNYVTDTLLYISTKKSVSIQLYIPVGVTAF